MIAAANLEQPRALLLARDLSPSHHAAHAARLVDARGGVAIAGTGAGAGDISGGGCCGDGGQGVVRAPKFGCLQGNECR